MTRLRQPDPPTNHAYGRNPRAAARAERRRKVFLARLFMREQRARDDLPRRTVDHVPPPT